MVIIMDVLAYGSCLYQPVLPFLCCNPNVTGREKIVNYDNDDDDDNDVNDDNEENHDYDIDNDDVIEAEDVCFIPETHESQRTCGLGEQQ